MDSLIALFASISAIQAAPDVFASPPKDAEFRWQAKHMIEFLQTPSCGRREYRAPPGFHRAELLKPEQDAVRKFEERIKGAPAEFDFDVAKADAAVELAQNDSCLAEYSDLRVANQHLKMTQDTVRDGLDRLRMLAPTLDAAAPTNISAIEGAKFRSLVRNLIESSRPRCRQTVKADNKTISSAAQAEVSLFRRRLEHSAYASHFDIAEADVAYEYSIVNVECDDPGLASAPTVSRRLLVSVKQQIAGIERKYRVR